MTEREFRGAKRLECPARSPLVSKLPDGLRSPIRTRAASLPGSFETVTSPTQKATRTGGFKTCNGNFACGEYSQRFAPACEHARRFAANANPRSFAAAFAFAPLPAPAKKGAVKKQFLKTKSRAQKPKGLSVLLFY